MHGNIMQGNVTPNRPATANPWSAVASCVVVAALLTASCSAKGEEPAVSDTTGADGSTSAAETAGTSFGELESPCGEGDFAVEADEAAGSPDVLRIGLANDRSSQIRPGLNKEVWDASNAFVTWCNEQGGIGGLPIEIVDLDGKLLDVQAAMTKACHGVFMMAGGGFVQDDLEFSGKPDSDFHRCGLVDIPAFAVSPQKSDSNGQVQPVPHTAAEIGTGWMQIYRSLEPENSASMAEVWGDLPSMRSIRNQAIAVMEDQDVEIAGVFDYPITGLTDWTPLARDVISSGASSMHWVGEPTFLGNFVKTLREQGWEGDVVVETNMYDRQYVDSAGIDNAAGTIIRTSFHPFEESDRWPATKQYVDIVNEYVDDAKIATLGVQSFSAWLLFATAATACGSDNDGVLTRECVLRAASDVEDWTGGGLHAPTDPGPIGGTPGKCEMLMVVNAEGGFERLSPDIDGDEDDGDGFTCFEDSLVDVPENADLGVIGPDQPL